MKKQVKTLIIVGAVLVVMVGVLVFLLNGGLPAAESSSSSSSDAAVELYSHEAADITKITVSGESSMTFTGDGEGGVKADGMGGLPVDSTLLTYIAKYAAALSGQQEVPAGGDYGQFGLEDGAVKVSIAYKDGSGESFSIGAEVPGAGTASRYIRYGDSVWTAYNTHVKYFMYTKEELVDKTLSPAYLATDGTTAQYDVTRVSMEGTSREAPFTLEYVDSNSVSGYTFTTFSITSPEVWSYTYSDAGTQLLHSAFGITAEEVALCNPTEDDLTEYGLAEPYSTVSVQSTLVSDGSAENFTLVSSEPAEGYAYMMREGVLVVYKVAVTDGMNWLSAVYTDYINSLLATPNINTVSKIELATPEGDYTFELKFETKAAESSDEEPKEELVSVSCSSTHPDAVRSVEITDIDNFRQLYQVFISADQESWAEDVPEELTSVLRITYYYREGGSDYVEMYEGPVRQVYIGMNGNVRFLTKSSVAEKILSDAAAFTKGEEVKA